MTSLLLLNLQDAILRDRYRMHESWRRAESHQDAGRFEPRENAVRKQETVQMTIPTNRS